MEKAVFGAGYVRRLIDDELDSLLPELPAILLDGPKGVGKTATAVRRCTTVRRLDERTVAEVVAADPSIVGRDLAPVLIDEWHRIPEVWDAVRRLVDEDPAPGRFMLTGSAPVRGTHSGAGRIVSLRLRPLCLAERIVDPKTVSLRQMLRGGPRPEIGGHSDMELDDYVEEIMASGFPALRRLSGAARTAAIDGYLERIVDHDLPEAGFAVRRPAALRAWLRAYAAATSTTAAWERVRDAASSGVGSKPAKTTTTNYTDLLHQLRVLDPIEAWSPSSNHLRRVGAAPKHHLADPSLAVRLLLRTKAHLVGGNEDGITVPGDGPLLGNLFESLAALTVRAGAQAANAAVYHLRTHRGEREIDFIVEGDEGVVAFEVKLSGSVSDRDVKHLHWLRDQLGSRLLDSAVITTGRDAYRRKDGIAVIPLALLGA